MFPRMSKSDQHANQCRLGHNEVHPNSSLNINRSVSKHISWNLFLILLIRAVTFDNAALDSRLLPFEERYTQVLDTVECEHPFIISSLRPLPPPTFPSLPFSISLYIYFDAEKIVAPRFSCTANVQLISWLQFVIDDGGEGAIARAPKSFYEPGRSTLLFKLKVK